MSKYRVYELAKEFTTTSKLILDILARNNMPAKNHMASIEEEAYQVLVRTFAPKPDTAEEIRERQRKKAAAAMPVPKVEPPKAPPAAFPAEALLAGPPLCAGRFSNERGTKAGAGCRITLFGLNGGAALNG